MGAAVPIHITEALLDYGSVMEGLGKGKRQELCGG